MFHELIPNLVSIDTEGIRAVYVQPHQLIIGYVTGPEVTINLENKTQMEISTIYQHLMKAIRDEKEGNKK